MPRTDRFSERIGAVFLPEADTIGADEDSVLDADGLTEDSAMPVPFARELELDAPFRPGDRLLPPWRICATKLKPGCYTLGFVPTGTTILGTRYRGTLRVESTGAGVRISGDLYTYRLLDDIVIKWPQSFVGRFPDVRSEVPAELAADTGGTIPIYKRRSYHSYLKGTGARLFSVVPRGAACSFGLSFDEFVYKHPSTGFSGSFDTSPTRSLRYELRKTTTPDLYTGDAFVGTAKIGTVSIRWVSGSYRRATVQLNTLSGAVSPPATVGTSSMASIFADVGWELTFTDGGAITLPAALSGTNVNACWTPENLHTLMSTVPGYNPAALDSVWRVHLVAVPATLGCSRGVMFDSSIGADPNAIPREGSATFSHDGYPAGDAPDGSGGSHYDTSANQQQRNVPRAYLRSATHEIGHAFNQIHQGFEAGNDNSIMTPTPGVATVLGTGGTFPDQINLGFNDTVKRHLRHLPDPAVRPGGMDFFGSAVAAPQAADVAWLETAELTITIASTRVTLGEPVELTYELKNAGELPLPVPTSLDTEALTLRINVTDPAGNITFMRPERVASCPKIVIESLEPRKSVKGSTTLFWGREGFAFQTPGHHVIEVIALWDVGGVPTGAAAEQHVFVTYPVTSSDNEVAALMLHPDVGAAVAAGAVAPFEVAAERVKKAAETSEKHPAIEALGRLGMLETPKPKPKRKRAATTRAGGRRGERKK